MDRNSKRMMLISLASLATGCFLLAGTVSAEAAGEAASPPVATETIHLTTGGASQETPELTVSGWQTEEDGGRRYYDPETGQPVTGVQEIEGVYYLFDFAGVQKTGWRTVNGIRQFYDPETGQLCSGWISYRENRYYADTDTGKQTGELTLSGNRYYLDEEYGCQHLGFCSFPDKTVSYYMEDGEAVSGWLDVNGRLYYFDANCQMQTGWQTIGGKKYYFGDTGAMYTSWHNIGSFRYYFSSSGVMQTGWQTIGSSRYYFNSSGAMQTGWQTISGSRYYFNSNGIMLTGRQTIDGNLYFFQENGAMRTNTTIDGYDIGADGVAVPSILIQYRDRVIALVNQQRAAYGLSSLSALASLNSAAGERAGECNVVFSHDRPDGSSCFTIFDQYGIDGWAWGENIAMGQTTPEGVMNSWMNSPGHRANILNGSYHYIGVGVVKCTMGGYMGYVWTQLFLG